MALRIWLPLINDLTNQGTEQTSFSIVASNTAINASGKLGKCYANNSNTAGGLISSTTVNLGTTQSMFCWFKFTSLMSNSSLGGAMVNQHRYSKNTGMGMTIKYVSSTTGYLSVNTGTGSSRTYNTYCGTTLLQANTWYHGGFTYDGTNVLKIYLNGVCEYTCNIGQMSCPADYFAIFAWSLEGSSGASLHGNYKLNGSINDVRVYDECLSDQRVEELSKGLILHYPLDDTRIEQTTNHGNHITDQAYNGATGKYNYGTNTDMYKTDGIFQGRQCTKVYMGTADLDCQPFINFANIHPENGGYRTLSFDYFPTSQTQIQFYTYAGSATSSCSVNYGPMTSGSTMTVKLNQWNHIILTLLGTSDTTYGWQWMKIGTSTHKSTTSEYWLVANVMTEYKDHPTNYVASTRTDTTIWDCSGYKRNGTVSSALIVKSPSPRYSASTLFSVNTDTISPPACFSVSQTVPELSIAIWFKTNTLNSTAPNPVSLGENSFIRFRLASATAMWCYYRLSTETTAVNMYSYTFESGKTLTDNTWHHFVTTFKDGVSKCYVDGTLIGTKDDSSAGKFLMCSSTAWHLAGYGANSENFIGSLSDFRLYASCLSVDQIQELCNNPVSKR